ncbi:RibD family protein [Falsirhodobacter sp. alg1]|uniref:RibD family protein n=1 Tax=Falsirhodobacter sp. alg1 TaxID=1472418 RepID=UPI0005EFFED5|nr:RibD family protein [Falsirhodobacter sp. alg1]
MNNLTITADHWQDMLNLRRGEGGYHGLHPVFSELARRDRPYVVAQVGQSLDGRVATPAGDARDISGPDGLIHLHRLRALCDAVIVGVGTVIADNPSLSVRNVPGPDPVRVVIDCNGRMPRNAQMLHDGGSEVLIVTAEDVPPPTLDATILQLPRIPSGLCPRAILNTLAARALTTVLVEGGARTIGRFLTGGHLDRLHVTVAPLIIGSGPSGIALPDITYLAQATRPAVQVHNLGSDILFDCDLSYSAKISTSI